MSSPYKAKIRMYRQGIGDCFLVSLPKQESDGPFRILIDCGVVLGTPDATQIMMNIVDSLQNATGGNTATSTKGTIDLLVVTHEHWDHVSAFNQVPDWKDRFDVKCVWAGWTENPDDAQAMELDKAKSHALAALSMASAKLGMSNTTGALAVNDMLAFYGMGPRAEADAFGVRATTRGGRDKALSLAGNNLVYLEPGGTPTEFDDLDDIKFYILGPPRNEKQLKKANPSKRNPETYGFGAGENGTMSLDRLNTALSDQTGPFSGSYNIPIQEARSMRFFQEHYFDQFAQGGKEIGVGEKEEKFPTELLSDSTWRTLDNDLSDIAADLAMKLDSATNNTSLAFAIELEPGGDVLLFPADAQVGSWLSWHDLEWSGDGVGVTATDLLKRTRFYKTGHHGSHNATLKELGLELMEHPDLVAMVPVDHKVAVKKRWHEMPLDDLMESLRKKTKGRLLRSDEDFPKRLSGVRKAAWEAFKKSVNTGKPGDPDHNTYFEITI